METINVWVNGKQIKMVLVEEIPVGPHSVKFLQENGWQVWQGMAKRPNGKKLHLVQRGARYGQYESLVSL